MNELVSWPRSRYVAGGGDALIFLEICGHFSEIPAVSRSKYSSNGVPDGVEAHLADNDFARYGDGPMLELLRASNPDAARQIEAAPHVLTLRGTVSDPPNLDYLRDCLGIIAALLDAGGAGVIEPQIFQLYSPNQWRESFWSGGFEPTSHTVILISPEESGTLWLHTRGMRIYGRPDLSCHGVLPEEVEKLQPVFNGLMRMQAAGALIPENQPVQAVGIEKRLICRHGGSFEDDDFNNLHLELRWDEVPI
ncbi:MAG TPA: hypothetical protein VF627_10850 [Abditibacterium sp.]|jgi:hypothetical protein